MNTLWQDLRYGLRMLWKSPGFTLVAIIALALGIGANTAIFSVVNAMLLRPLPYSDPDRIVTLWETNPNLTAKYLRTHNEASPANFYDWRGQQTVFDDIGAFRWNTFNLTGVDTPEQLLGNRATASLFRVLAVKPLLGRTFTEEEDRDGSPRVVVLSYGLWQRRFGGDPDIINRQISIDTESHTVIGVMPREFEFPNASVEMWTPLALDSKDAARRGAHYLYTRARLKSGVTLEQAQGEMNTIAARLRQQYPDTNADRDVRVVRTQDDTNEQLRPALFVLFAAVGFVLLIACANVANLSLARSSARHKELSIRAALGASRARMIRQMLTESVLLSTMGGVGGVLLAMWGLDLVTASVPRDYALSFHGWNQIKLDGWVLAFTMLVAVATGLLFGIVPALQATKTDLNESLKEGGGRGSASHARRRFRDGLVIAEVALALVLLVGAGLMFKSFARMLDVQPGFDPHGVVTMGLGLPEARYAKPEQWTQFYKQLLEKLRAEPGVESASVINYLPMGGSGGTTTFIIDGRPAPPKGQNPEANFRAASSDYFKTLRIPLLKGRAFTDQDTADKPLVAIVNETFARTFFSGEEVIGKRLRDPDGTNPTEIVGVVSDVKHWGLDDEPEPYLYMAHAQSPDPGMTIAVRSAIDPSAMAATVRRDVQTFDRDLPVFDIKSLEQRVEESGSQKRLTVYLLTVFAAVALLLAAVGIYGVLAYSVAQRTHEIGIRMALGAQTRDVVRLVLRQGMVLALVGVVAGVLASLALTKLIKAMLFHVSPTDPATFALVSVALASVALVACLVPARRATKVDPMIALRYE
jgi:putative ABC transport system permease protein